MQMIINTALIVLLIINTITDIKKIKSNKELSKSDEKIYEAQKELRVRLDERNEILKEVKDKLGRDLK